MVSKVAVSVLLSTLALSASTMEVLHATEASAEPCTTGDALAMFEALQVATNVMRPRGIEAPKLLDTLSRCQYRLFRNGATFTFSEEDTFLGGVLWLYDYDNLGLTREEAIADLESIQDRVWLAEVQPGGATGPWVEQPLMRTAYKNIESAVFGLTVLQHRAFITRLPPGEYWSYWESRSPGAPDVTATVRLSITPASVSPAQH